MAALPRELMPAQLPVPAVAPGPAAVPDRRPRRTPRRGDRRSRYVGAMTLLVAATVFGCVTLNALAAEQSFAARELEQQVTDLTRATDELTVEITRLESPARVHRRAVRQLGMVRAEQPAFVVLPRSASTDSQPPSSTMAAAQPADGR